MIMSDVLLSKTQIKEIKTEIEKLRCVCAEAYQLAGAYDADVKALDNLSAAANGDALPHASFLPIFNQYESSHLGEPKPAQIPAELVAWANVSHHAGHGYYYNEAMADARAFVREQLAKMEGGA